MKKCFSFEFFDSCWRLLTDGSRPTVPEQSVGLRATLQRTEDHPEGAVPRDDGPVCLVVRFHRGVPIA